MGFSSQTVTTEHAWLNHPHTTILSYNERDCVATIRAAKSLRTVLERNKQWEFYRRFIWPTVPPTMRMQARGLPYDTKLRDTYRRSLRLELGSTDNELRAHFARTYASPEATTAIIWQTLAWSLPELELEGYYGTKPKPFARRKSPFTEAEWAKLSKHSASGFNPNSRDQLRVWLFHKDGLGLRPPASKQYLTDTGKVSVDQQTLNHLLQRRSRSKAESEQILAATPIIHLLMHRARLQKIDQDYLDPEVRYEQELHGVRVLPSSAVSEGRRGRSDLQPMRELVQASERQRARVFPRIKILGTESGRYAYAEPPVHSWPDEIRHIVRASPSHTIIGADYSAVEARVFAILTNDRLLLELFENNRLYPDNKRYDLHITNFCDFFGWKFEQFTAQNALAQKASRNFAKVIQYGVFQYGGEPATVRSKIYCPCKRCEAKAPPVLEVTPERRVIATQRWFVKHPAVVFWRARISKQLLDTKWLTNPFGRRRYFAAPFSREQEREGWNWMIQSTALDIIQRALVELDSLGAPLILQHHDALYLESPDADVVRWSALLKTTMEKPVPELRDIIFPVEVATGQSWGDLH